MKNFLLKLKFCVLACAVVLGSAHAQTSATAPIRILVGAPAGGTTDTMARTLAQAMGQQLGRVVVVETNRAQAVTWPPTWWPKRHQMAIPC